MRSLDLMVPLLALTLCGCHKNAAEGPAADHAASAAPAAETAGIDSAQPAGPPPSHVVARANNSVNEMVVGEVDPFLTDQLRAFVQQKGRLPGSFAEFASARLDSIPRPPEGRKWAIDGSNLEVKAVAGK
jgi:hypothetical protein